MTEEEKRPITILDELKIAVYDKSILIEKLQQEIAIHQAEIEKLQQE